MDTRQVAESVEDEGQQPRPLNPVNPPHQAPIAVRWQDRNPDEVIHEILTRLDGGETLTSICASPGIPSLSLVKQWRREDEDLAARFVRAREGFWVSLADQVIDIIDGKGHVEDRKLRAWGRLQLLDRVDAAKKTEPKGLGKGQPVRVLIVGIEPRALAAPIEGQAVRVEDDEDDP